MCNNRLDASKRKVAHLSLNDLVVCADVFMGQWGAASAASREGIDPALVQDLREIRDALNDRREPVEDIKAILAASFAAAGSNAVERLGGNFRSVLRGILSMGAGLAHSKEVRGLFVNLLERLVDPLKAAKWSLKEVQDFLQGLPDAFENTGTLPIATRKRYAASLRRFAQGLAVCAPRVYQ